MLIPRLGLHPARVSGDDMTVDKPMRPADLHTEMDPQSHLAELENTSRDELIVERRTLEDVQGDIALVREEVEHIRARLSVIARQADSAIRLRAQWADASAHAQLGEYPWLKLAGAMTTTFIATRLIRRLPLGPLVTASLPLLAATFQRKIYK